MATRRVRGRRRGRSCGRDVDVKRVGVLLLKVLVNGIVAALVEVLVSGRIAREGHFIHGVVDGRSLDWPVLVHVPELLSPPGALRPGGIHVEVDLVIALDRGRGRFLRLRVRAASSPSVGGRLLPRAAREARGVGGVSGCLIRRDDLLPRQLGEDARGAAVDLGCSHQAPIEEAGVDDRDQ